MKFIKYKNFSIGRTDNLFIDIKKFLEQFVTNTDAN